MKKKKKKKAEKTPEPKPNGAVFTSPIGLVRCLFSKKGRLTACYPLSDEDWPLYGDSILHDRGEHPTLAEAFWNGTSIPKKYEPKFPEVEGIPNIWKELMKVPLGQQLSYKEFTKALGLPSDEEKRVEEALQKNDFCLLVPCHRIIGDNGDIGSYRWEVKKKRAILDYENYLLTKR